MDKKVKQRRHKSLDQDELEEITPRGASFDTEEGRAAQGMRPDIGAGASNEERRRDELAAAVGGASDGNSGAGTAAGIPDGDTATSTGGDAATKGEAQEDRKKLFPEAKSDAKKRET